MKLDVVEGLIDLVERFGVVELDYTEGGTRVRMSRGRDVPAKVDVIHEEIGSSSVRSWGAGAADSSAPAPIESEHVIAAGMIGTFYRSPKPGEPPFVAEGDLVEDGQTLGILEAMKMLNPVEADRVGRLLRVLAEDGAAVAAGTPLFAIALTD